MKVSNWDISGVIKRQTSLANTQAYESLSSWKLKITITHQYEDMTVAPCNRAIDRSRRGTMISPFPARRYAL
jgi:hypothetical protein